MAPVLCQEECSVRGHKELLHPAKHSEGRLLKARQPQTNHIFLAIG